MTRKSLVASIFGELEAVEDTDTYSRCDVAVSRLANLPTSVSYGKGKDNRDNRKFLPTFLVSL